MKESVDAPDVLNATGDFERHVVRAGRVPPLPPKNWFLDTKGNGIVVRVVNRGNLGTDSAISGAVRYDVHWAETVDTTTSDGIEAGFRRSKVIASVPALDIEDMESESGVIDDESYQSGYFYVVARSAENDRSVIGQPKRLSNQILSTNIPSNVEHFQVTESGEMHNGTVWSELSVSYRAPTPLNGFAGLQLVLGDYPNIGETTYWVTKRYEGLARGSGQFKELAQVCRRIGTGTISVTIGATGITGVGTKFRQQMKAGDYLEIAGKMAEIASVTNDTTATLSANWAGNRSYAGMASWEVIGKVRVYGRALSDGHVGDADLSTLPYVDVLMDGALSAPNAPTISGATRSDAIVITFQAVLGTQIKGYRLYRGTGTGTAFVNCVAIDWVDHPKDIGTAATSRMEFIDKDFTVYQREQGQVFAYYVTTVNERDEASAPSTGVNVTCRLDSGPDNAPPTTARDIPRNLLWNGMLWFNVNATIDVTNINQDTKMGGGVPPAGHYRWDHAETAAVTPAGFENSTEIILPAAGAGKYCSATQRVDGWDNANSRIPKGATLVFQMKARSTGGTANGTLGADISQMNNAGVHQGYAYVRERLSNDTIQETATAFNIDPTELEADYRLYWCVFKLRTALTTDRILLRIFYQNGTGAANIDIAQVMLSRGEALPIWTGELQDSNIYYPPPTGGAPTPPTAFPDLEGSGRPFIDLQVP